MKQIESNRVLYDAIRRTPKVERQDVLGRVLSNMTLKFRDI
jgi:hypothetical protein